MMQMVTINWHIYVLTDSPIALGLVSLVRVVPIVLFSLIGGVFADARDRKKVMLVTQFAMMLFAALLGLITHLGIVSALSIYLLAALTSAASAFDTPARLSLAPNLVPKEHLTNAVSLTNLMQRFGAVVGPSLAGFVIAAWSVGAVYWINAISFLAVLIALVLLKTPTQENLGATRVTLGAVTEGVRFVRHSKIILSAMLLDFFAEFFGSASALLPIFARDILQVGPQGLGILYSAQSIGSVLSGAALSIVGRIRRAGIVVLVAVAIYGVATVLYGISQLFLLSVLFLALLGAANTVSAIMRQTIRQLATPDRLRGRTTSVSMIFAMGGPQLGNLEAGIVAALFGAPLSVISGGIATVIIVALVAWLAPQFREYRDS